MGTDYIISRGFFDKKNHFKYFNDGVQQPTSGQMDRKQKKNYLARVWNQSNL